MIRNEVEKQTSLGNQVKEIIAAGKYPDDSIFIELVRQVIQEQRAKSKGIVFDGFPRTVAQAEALDRLLNEVDLRINYVIELNISEKDLVDRIVNRFSCQDCGATYNKKFSPPKSSGICDVCGGTTFSEREDDTEEVIKERFRVYCEMTAPLMPYYKAKGFVVEIDGAQAADVVAKQIETVMKKPVKTAHG